jgi:DNA-binding MarR family transcriptional regulator
MGDALHRRIQQTRFQSPIHEALINVIVAANDLRQLMEKAAAGFGITLPQYNVLRILRGAHPEGHPRGAIAARMLDRAPDVTRIIDRLEEKALVARDRTGADRRHSITRITADGLALLERMEPAMEEALTPVKERLTLRDARELSRLCELLYDGR